jgi:hypothetical protein
MRYARYAVRYRYRPVVTMHGVAASLVPERWTTNGWLSVSSSFMPPLKKPTELGGYGTPCANKARRAGSIAYVACDSSTLSRPDAVVVTCARVLPINAYP